MIRALFATVAFAGLLSVSRADVEVAPPPREIRADGSRDTAPVPAAPAPAEDPAVTVDRIIKNSRAVGDKLAGTDTGNNTRTTQSQILKDIESLIDRHDDSPPKSGGSGDKNDQKKSDKNKGEDNGKQKSPSGMSDQQPKDGKNPKGGMDPKDGDNQQAKGGRRPRMGSPGDKGDGKDKDMGMANNAPMEGKAPMPGGKGGDSKTSKAGGVAGNPMGPAMARPSLPINDDVVKEVWGHLPDKLRQQVTQYYKEEFMPKYADLLKQYYSSLANSPPRMP